jgi:hypothetical protein
MALPTALLLALLLLGALQHQAAGDLLVDTGCPCTPSTLCRSLSPQPVARSEVLAFHSPDIYGNGRMPDQHEPSFFRHYPWANVTTVAAFLGTEGRPGSEGPHWDTSAYTPEIVCLAHRHGARVVGHIGHGATTWPQLLNATWRQVWVTQIVEWFINDNGFDGIQFDIEDLLPEYTEAATSLACELRAALTAALPGSSLSWCCDSSPKSDPGYSFSKLSSCVDYFAVMEYAHGFGPAWQSGMAEGLAKYQALGVDSSKLVYVLPWFGVEWVCEEAQGVNCTYACMYRGERCNVMLNGARPVSDAGYAEIMEAQTAAGHTVKFQPHTTPSPFVDIVRNGTRFRWEFDDPRSIHAKVSLLHAAGVGGVGSWTADALDYSNASMSSAMWRALLSGGGS